MAGLRQALAPKLPCAAANAGSPGAAETQEGRSPVGGVSAPKAMQTCQPLTASPRRQATARYSRQHDRSWASALPAGKASSRRDGDQGARPAPAPSGRGRARLQHVALLCKAPHAVQPVVQVGGRAGGRRARAEARAGAGGGARRPRVAERDQAAGVEHRLRPPLPSQASQRCLTAAPAESRITVTAWRAGLFHCPVHACDCFTFDACAGLHFQKPPGPTRPHRGALLGLAHARSPGAAQRACCARCGCTCRYACRAAGCQLVAGPPAGGGPPP